MRGGERVRGRAGEREIERVGRKGEREGELAERGGEEERERQSK